MWTQFWDVGSGKGGFKAHPYRCIYIEAPEVEARTIFYNRFGRNADRITCTCCGRDYSVYEDDTLEGLTEYHRRPGTTLADWERGYPLTPLDAYLARDDVLAIYAADIKESERTGDIPQQGWIRV